MTAGERPGLDEEISIMSPSSALKRKTVEKKPNQNSINKVLTSHKTKEFLIYGNIPMFIDAVHSEEAQYIISCHAFLQVFLLLPRSQ